MDDGKSSNAAETAVANGQIEATQQQPFSGEGTNERSIVTVMENAYLDYSMSVIVSRALPDVRDGLKPVQRRILYAMLREGLLHNRPFDKCAGVIGEVLKNYHPHGDSSVYDALVRLAQPWVMRYPLILSQGNFGSIDGDSAAAYRYTECKLGRMAEDLLRDLDEGTVEFMANYKESAQEPTVLPAALPNLLLNGSTGIAVGMTTNIPPHNLREIVDAIIAIIDNPQLTFDELEKIIRGPDFPTGGEVVGMEGISRYLRTGRGIIRVRGKVRSEEMATAGKEQLIIEEIPYNVNRASLVEKIAELVTAKVIDEISDIRDESTEVTRIVLEIKRGESSRVLINKLFKHTSLENSFGVILLALDAKRPKQMDMRTMLDLYLEHRRDVISRRILHRLQVARDRAHVLEGFRIALNNLDEFVRIIRAADDREMARHQLIQCYQLSERQADSILELRLYQLTGMEQTRVEGEYGELLQRIGEYEAILADPALLMALIRSELVEIRNIYGDDRKTKIVPAEGEFCIEDIIPNECCIITISNKNFIKRTSADAYHTQKRGGKGVIGAGQHDDDFVEHIFSGNAHSYILFFMNNGRLYVQKVYDIPEAARTSKGRSIVNLLNMQEGERIAAMMCVEGFDSESNVIMCTRQGVIKKTALADYRNFRRDGTIGINIDDGDALIAAHLTSGNDEIIIVTRGGISIKFHESDLRVQGRATRGVRGINLADGDSVAMMTVANAQTSLLLATENGLGKRSHFADYRLQRRGGKGLIAMRTRAPICAALSVGDSDQIMLFTKLGQAVRTKVSDIRIIGRTTQGVRLIHLAEKDRLKGISHIADDDETE